MSTIANGANRPLFYPGGTVPGMETALEDWYQNIVFIPIVKTVSGFQVVETTSPINFRGMIQPFTPRELQLRPEGERSWSFFKVFAQVSLVLKTDDIILWLNKPTRVMAKTDWSLYSYVEYAVCQDWETGLSL